MREVQSLGLQLSSCAHLMRERIHARMSQFDVTPVQTHVLMYLFDAGEQTTQQALGEHLRVRPSTVNGIVDRLAEKGLLTRTISNTDARCRMVTLTPDGVQLHNLICATFDGAERDLLRGFSAEQERQLSALLDLVIENLEEDRGKC